MVARGHRVFKKVRFWGDLIYVQYLKNLAKTRVRVPERIWDFPQNRLKNRSAGFWNIFGKSFIAKSPKREMLYAQTGIQTVTPCRNGTILAHAYGYGKYDLGYSTISKYCGWFVASTGKFIDVTTIPELSAGKNHMIVFMEDGNYLVTMVNADGTGRYYAILDRFGKVLSGPQKYEGELPSKALVTDPYLAGTQNGVRSILNIVNADLIQVRRSGGYSDNSFEYVSYDGQTISNQKYTLATEFSNGYAIVATETKKVDYLKVAENLKFINTRGEHVDKVQLLEEEDHHKGDQIDSVHSAQKTIKTIETILSTDQEF